MNAQPTLEERVAALEAAQQLDTLTPTYLTVSPTGLVGANFSGIVNALGVYLPESVSGVIRQQNALLWQRPDQVNMDMTTNPPPLFMTVQEALIGPRGGGALKAGELAQVTAQAVNSPQSESLVALLRLIANGALFSGGGAAQQSRLDIQADNAANTVDSYLIATASNNAAVILDGTGASSFNRTGAYVIDEESPPGGGGWATNPSGGGAQGAPLTFPIDGTYIPFMQASAWRTVAGGGTIHYELDAVEVANTYLFFNNVNVHSQMPQRLGAPTHITAGTHYSWIWSNDTSTDGNDSCRVVWIRVDN